MVPKGWTLLQVSDICKLQNGNSFKPHEWDTQGIPIIRIQNLNGSDNYNYFSGVPQDKWLVEPGQLLFSWAGTKGVSFGPFIWNGPKGVLNQHIYKVFANENVHGHWLYLALLHITQKIEAQAHGFKSTLLHVQKKDIDNQFVLTPPVAEQKKIAQILSTWDKAISVTEKLLANSQQQKKALMQQLLTGKKRLLDENGGRFSGEWYTCSLSEVAHIIMGSSPKSEAYNDNGLGLPLIQGNTDIKCRVSCPRVYTSDITKECSPGDILLSVRAPVGTVALSQHKACIGRGISAIKSKRKMSQSFLYQWFLWFEPKWCSLSQGSTFESINSDDIKTLKLAIPNYEEQQKIAIVLSAADVEISTLEKKLACLKDEKKALMQQLLTGKRRVKIDEAVAA
ncbi:MULTISPECIES: restriction endonuclease subunit S [Citrobacter]|uniref:Restriction endonuclease subunit S n=1 Tax=Citrobacter braakii TaxID=57706 RepID=A0A1V8P2E5_CITBR|nr:MULTISPECIES: restriction endonuclease subunit S [Citrobacter]MDW2593527.1 restriction endonuclease subunit S [Citrobacter braakii]MDW2657140.1 restriction endonuclease subunit S [Citrobacter braakii]MDW2705055.1 restriction endonuclease subunit S [Citrobacter braakii]OQM42878.1 restriction endonuclease subunit S [Citrobacter braakii]PAX78497.1 restriction endonuclease subunit S [Citrobacter sp. TSA-1]